MTPTATTPTYVRIRNIARGLDKTAQGLPFAPDPKAHFSLLRREHGRGGWEAMAAKATALARDYEAQHQERRAQLNDALNAPRYSSAAPVAFEPIKRPSLAVRLMQWIRGCFLSSAPANG